MNVKQSMKQMERATEEAYADASSRHHEIKLINDEARKLRMLILVPLPFLVALIVGVFLVTPWFAALGPLIVLLCFLTSGVRYLHWLTNVKLPMYTRKYREALTEATNALQRQEDRRRMGLMSPEEYVKIEDEAQRVIRDQEEANNRRFKRRADEEMWDIAFRHAINPMGRL